MEFSIGNESNDNENWSNFSNFDDISMSLENFIGDHDDTSSVTHVYLDNDLDPTASDTQTNSSPPQSVQSNNNTDGSSQLNVKKNEGCVLN